MWRMSAEELAMEQELQSKVLKVTEFVTANELAIMMDVPVTQDYLYLYESWVCSYPSTNVWMQKH